MAKKRPIVSSFIDIATGENKLIQLANAAMVLRQLAKAGNQLDVDFKDDGNEVVLIAKVTKPASDN